MQSKVVRSARGGVVIGLGVLMLVAPSVRAVNMGTAFSYQGRLVRNGVPVGSSTAVICNFRFSLFDAPVGGMAKGNSP